MAQRRTRERKSSRSTGNAEHDLAELLAGLEPLVRGAGLGEREDRVDDRPRTAALDELEGAFEVLLGAHRGAENRELLPPHPLEGSGRIRPARRAADDHAAALGGDVERGPPGRLADMLDDDVGPEASGQLLDGRLHVVA